MTVLYYDLLMDCKVDRKAHSFDIVLTGCDGGVRRKERQKNERETLMSEGSRLSRRTVIGRVLLRTLFVCPELSIPTPALPFPVVPIPSDSLAPGFAPVQSARTVRHAARPWAVNWQSTTLRSFGSETRSTISLSTRRSRMAVVAEGAPPR